MKRLFFILMVLVGFAMQALAYDFQAGNLLYTIISTDPPCVSIDGHVDGTNAQGELVIPEMVEHEGIVYMVTEIGNRAFLNCSGLTGGLVIPATIDTIQLAAFYGCSGFTGTLAIPNTVVLKNHVFQYCRGFSELIFPDTISEIPKELFFGCSGLTGILAIPESVNIIGESAFSGCSGFSRLKLPDGLREIRERAFKDCTGFTGTLDIPATVTHIKYGAFCNCSGFSGDLIIPNSVVELGTTQNDYWMTNEPPSASYASFADCFDHLVLSESLDSIGVFCFYECSRLCGDLVIPNSVKGIMYMAFRNCSGFSSLTLGNSLNYIGYEAFEGCTGFKGTLVVPESVTTIESGAFSGCSGVENIELSPNIQFKYCSDGIFSCCTSLVSLNIPEGWTKTGNNTFSYCTNLAKVHLPESLEVIGEGTFNNCRSLKEINLPKNLKQIGLNAFGKCVELSGDLVVPSQVESILPYTFDSCVGIKRLVLGDSIKTIYEAAFRSTMVESIVLKTQTPPELFAIYPFSSPWMFSDDISITIPCGTLETYQNSEYWNRFANLNEGNTLLLSVVPEDETFGEVIVVKEAFCDDMSVGVKAVPANGYVFLYWEANGEQISTDNPYYFDFVEDTELVANFSGMSLSETKLGFSLYPNPAKDRVIISGIEPNEVQIYNVLGRLVRTEQNSREINMDGLPRGVYFLNIINKEDGAFVCKVVKE